jgi:hypothetical protein
MTSLLVLAVAGPLALYDALRPTVEPRTFETVASRLDDFGPRARARLSAPFARAGVPYPPPRMRLAAFKREARLDLFAGAGEDLRFIKSYALIAGPQPARDATLGPKRAEGDRRVPEGLYRLDYLNPNSVEHVSIKIGYPNRFDRARAAEAGRDPATLGDDIMLHGGAPLGTEGCLALTDAEMEELFTLVADARAEAEADGRRLDADILIAPADFRFSPLDHAAIERATRAGDLPRWAPLLYAEIDRSLADLPGGDRRGRNLRTLLAAD